jgi:hypothetical protein
MCFAFIPLPLKSSSAQNLSKINDISHIGMYLGVAYACS